MKMFTLHHGTHTGGDNEVLRSLQEHGPRIPQGNVHTAPSGHYVQKDGYFCTSHIRQAERYMAFHMHDERGERRQDNGQPLVVTIEDDMQSGWQFDYEIETRRTRALLFDFQEELSRIPADTLEIPVNGNLQKMGVISSATLIDDGKKDGIEFTVALLGSEKQVRIFLSWDHGVYMTPKEEEVTSQNYLLQKLRDYLASAVGDRFLHAEREAIIDAIEGPNAEVALKYTGNRPLKIVRLDISDGKRWIDQPLTISDNTVTRDQSRRE